MRQISITEFRKNLSYYLELCAMEEVRITKYSEVVAVLSRPDTKYYETLTRLYGCLKDCDTGQDYDEMIGEEIMKAALA